jgi:sugar diacid utilization regulator
MSEEKDFWGLAARFVRFVHGETKLPLIVCDQEGIIREAVVRSRVGTPHSGAQRILRGEVDEAFVTAEEAARDPRVKEGYNCPIVFEGKRIGTFGIAGPLEISRPMSRVAAAVLSSWLKEQAQERRLGEAASQVMDAVKTFGASVDDAVAHAAHAAGQTVEATRAAEERLALADTVVRQVDDIAQQSRMLAINASVEATRAGDSGRAFGVLSREMLTLADHSRLTSQKIAASLRDIKQALNGLQEASAGSSKAAQQQAEMLGRLLGLMGSLQHAIEGVTASFTGVEGAGHR